MLVIILKHKLIDEKSQPVNLKDITTIIKSNFLKPIKQFFLSNSKFSPISAINIINLEIN